MADQSGGEKTLPASPRKKLDSREKGNVAKSQDLAAASTLLFALLGLWALGPSSWERLLASTRYFISEADTIPLSPANAQSFLITVMLHVAPIILPFMVLLMVAGVAINVAQFGFLFSSKALIPKPERLNPISGFKRFLSIRAFVDLIKALFKLSLVGYIVYLSIRGSFGETLSLMHLTPEGSSLVVWNMVLLIWFRIVLVMLLIGILDYGFQYWQRERDLRMTQQEARQELKELEGDPQIKQRIRQIQRQVAMQRMMGDVPEADVVITNPTTYAIALRYDLDTMNAPLVVAKGARLQAERIRAIAVEHDVPIVERPELARSLYRSIELGQPVPENLFNAVAEVLAYVYEIDRREEKVRERQGSGGLAAAS